MGGGDWAVLGAGPRPGVAGDGRCWGIREARPALKAAHERA